LEPGDFPGAAVTFSRREEARIRVTKLKIVDQRIGAKI